MATVQDLLGKLKEMKAELAEKDTVISEQMHQVTQLTQETNGLKQRVSELEEMGKASKERVSQLEDLEKAHKELLAQLEQIVE